MVEFLLNPCMDDKEWSEISTLYRKSSIELCTSIGMFVFFSGNFLANNTYLIKKIIQS